MTTATGPRPLSTPAAAWLVAGREIRARLRSRAFLVSSGILLGVVLVTVILGGVLSANPAATHIAVVQGAVPTAVIQDAHGLAPQLVPDTATAEHLVRTGAVAAAAVPDPGSTLGFAIVAESSPPTDVLSELSVSPSVHLLAPEKGAGLLRYLVAIGFGLVFFVSGMTFGQLIAQSVVEEKATRIVEILLAAIPARALLAGKVIGSTILALVQIVLLLGIALGGLALTGQTGLIGQLRAPVVWFAVFFVFGFLLLATMFAATGALVSRQEDAAATTMPVTMLVMAPYVLIIVLNGNDTAVGIMSYIPFSAPVAMPLRMFLGTAQWWEPLISLAILIVTVLLMLQLGARIYENALLRLGTRVPWRQAFRRAT
jgi:ABC-2 type transport system permease protein